MEIIPKYGGTLREMIASHVRGLPQKSKKVGVWEDTRMLKSSSGDCASGVGLVGANNGQIWCSLGSGRDPGPGCPGSFAESPENLPTLVQKVAHSSDSLVTLCEKVVH